MSDVCDTLRYAAGASDAEFSPSEIRELLGRAADAIEVMEIVVGRYGRLYIRDEAYYRAADVLGWWGPDVDI